MARYGYRKIEGKGTAMGRTAAFRKVTVLPIILMLMIGAICHGQIVHVHTHMNNNDRETRKKLAVLIGTLGARNATLARTNGLLRSTLTDYAGFLGRNYTKNTFDKKDDFLTSSASSMALSLASTILSTYQSMPYMTRVKRDYIRAITLDKSVLLALQYIDPSKVKASKRQEIYRLRSALIREYSKGDREARKMLLFSAGGFAIINYTEFQSLMDQLKGVEIIL